MGMRVVSPFCFIHELTIHYFLTLDELKKTFLILHLPPSCLEMTISFETFILMIRKSIFKQEFPFWFICTRGLGYKLGRRL